VSYATKHGRTDPLGATFDGNGVNFALFSENATGVDVCLFDDSARETRIRMRSGAAHVWCRYVEGLKPGQRYGFRVHGPYDPKRGHRFNANKLLVDPYARAFAGKVDYHAPVFGYARRAMEEDTVADPRDDAWGVPRSVVVQDTFDWGDDRRPEVNWTDTVLYEVHVKGFTRRHHDVPSELRGTYRGVSSAAAIAHLKSIGVTTVELMPVHEVADEALLAARGMTNYWGYNTLGFFAPDQRFASHPCEQVTEFKTMVKELHAAGIEVVLDVVYNHTCEGDRLGPTLCLRGIDNLVYYRVQAKDHRLYEDYSGCGNSLNMGSPQVLKLIMDSLRYWVNDMHVDGFRFDLASSLARDAEHVDKLSAFFDIIHQDPVLSRVKLIAEPWDLGIGGYQVGNFPVLWNEWNGRYRDTVRHFWIGRADRLGDLGYRLTGSSDLYQDDGRHPHASINFVTAHDGFTLRDLVSYEKKHNEANGEKNRDGWDDNISANCGVEGETSDPEIVATRARQVRNILATLFLSQGTPMITAGDEIGKTQHGNNNPYVQDNPISWLDWELDQPRKELLAFVQRLAKLRREHPIFRRRAFLRGASCGRAKDITWVRADGFEMTGEDWTHPSSAAIGLLLSGDLLPWPDEERGTLDDDSFLFVLSAHDARLSFHVPEAARALASEWTVEIDTAGLPKATWRPGEAMPLLPGSVVVLREVRAPGSVRAPR